MSRAARLGEFLMTGGMTLPLLAVAWWLGRTFDLDQTEYQVSMVAFYGAHAINDPHFAVTYLLFYRRLRERLAGGALPPVQRLRFLVAGFVVPAALTGVAVWALRARDTALLGGMVELMYLLVGWHYAKQGFGVAAVLSARRGLPLDPLERRTLLAHAYATWAFAWASPADPGSLLEERGLVFHSTPRGPLLESVTFAAFVATGVAALVVFGVRRRRSRRPLPWGPVGSALITFWLLTTYTNLHPLIVYVIPAIHSLQYLTFVWWQQRGEARSAEGPPAFGKPAAQVLLRLAALSLGLGFLLFHGIPGALDELAPLGTEEPADGELGPTPWLVAVATAVNIHHYFMDHVIWRREQPETRFLARG